MNRPARSTPAPLAALRRFVHARDGGVAIVAAFALPCLLMLGGGAVDLQRTEQARSSLQDAMDAAVLSGAAANPRGDKVAAEKAFVANAAPGTPTPVFTARAGVVSGSANLTVRTSFLSMIGVETLPISARARAVVGATKTCVLLLDPSSEQALAVNSGAVFDSQVCRVQVNSSNAKAVVVNNNSTVRAEALCVNGGVITGGGAQVIPTAQTGCRTIADPLAGLPEPTIAGPCPDVTANNGATVRLAPGCYGKVTASNSGRISLDPGLYRFTNKLEASNSGSISGSGVTLYLNTAQSQVIGNSSVSINLSAPTTGPYAGVLFFQTRTASNANASGLVMNSGVTGKLEGVIYMPHTRLVLNSDVVTNAVYTLIIAKGMELNSGSQYVVRDVYDGALPLPRALTSVRLEDAA